MSVQAVALALVLASAPEADEAAVKRADQEMSRASERRDVAGFLALVAEDALFGGASGFAEGRDAVRERWAPFFVEGGASLTWRPARAVVAGSGDLAFTVGRYRLTRAGASEEGEYVTVWRKEGDAWRALVDMPNEPAAAAGPGLEHRPIRVVASGDGELEATAGTLRRTNPNQEPSALPGGIYLSVRRRATGGDWQIVVDTAVVRRRGRALPLRRSRRRLAKARIGL